MTRKNIVDELSRENKLRVKFYPRWVQYKKMTHQEAAERKRLTQFAEALFGAMTDEEFSRLAARLEIGPEREVVQGELF